MAQIPTFFPQGHPELEKAWQSLLGGPEAVHPITGDMWQYMGSYKGDAGYAHEFRHRSHPTTNKREYRKVVVK